MSEEMEVLLAESREAECPDRNRLALGRATHVRSVTPPVASSKVTKMPLHLLVFNSATDRVSVL